VNIASEKDAAHMTLNSLLGNPQSRRHLLVGAPERYELKNLVLAL
jgi:hypothetical protein